MELFHSPPSVCHPPRKECWDLEFGSVDLVASKDSLRQESPWQHLQDLQHVNKTPIEQKESNEAYSL